MVEALITTGGIVPVLGDCVFVMGGGSKYVIVLVGVMVA
jgi:hypothetical protein